MLDWISKKSRDKKLKEANEEALKRSLAEKVSKYQNQNGESQDDYTEITIAGELLRVAKQQITLADPWVEQKKSSNC